MRNICLLYTKDILLYTGIPVYQGTIKLQKTCFPDAGCNKTGITVVVSCYNSCIPVNSGKLSLLNWSGLQQEHEFNSDNNEN